MKPTLYTVLCLLLFSACEYDKTYQLPEPSTVESVSPIEVQNILQPYGIHLDNKHRFPSASKAMKTNARFLKEFDIEKLSYENISNTNAKIAVVPATIKYDDYYSRVLLLKIDGQVESVTLNTKQDPYADDEDFTGEMVVSDLDGNYIRGFKVVNGKIVMLYLPEDPQTTQNASILTALSIGSLMQREDRWQIDLRNVEVWGNVSSSRFKISWLFNKDWDEEESGGGDSGRRENEDMIWDSDPEEENGSGPPKKEEEEDIIINELTGKALCVYNKLEKLSGGFRNAIKKFDGEFPVSHLNLSINNSLPNGIYGITKPPLNTAYSPNDYNIDIEISNKNLEEISNLGSALVFIHEIIHAETFRLMMSAAKKGHLNTSEFTGEEIISFLNNLRENSEGIFDYYYERRETFGVPDEWSHEQMAAHYRDVIANVLQEFDNFSLERHIYEDIAWAGLRYNKGSNNSKVTTIAWSELSESEKQRIVKNLNKYFFDENKNCN